MAPAIGEVTVYKSGTHRQTQKDKRPIDRIKVVGGLIVHLPAWERLKGHQRSDGRRRVLPPSQYDRTETVTGRSATECFAF